MSGVRLGPARRTSRASMLGVLFLAASYSAAPGQDVPVGLQCTVSCSTEEEGLAVARLEWDEAKAPRDPARLDWTVYPDGFRKEAYVGFSLLPGGADREPSIAGNALQNLRPFQLRLDTAGDAGAVERSSGAFAFSGAATVENLEPGINYSFRLAFERDGGHAFSETATCQAPVCIREEAEEEGR